MIRSSGRVLGMQGILWAIVQNLDLLSKVPPRFEMVQCHHITLQYGAELEAWSYLVGYEFEAIATSECWNNQIQALRVTLPPLFPVSIPTLTSPFPIEPMLNRSKQTKCSQVFINQHLSS